MIRLIGILIGAALAIASLIVALGLPQLSSSAPTTAIETEQPDVAAANEPVGPRTDVAPEAPAPTPEPAAPGDPVSAPAETAPASASDDRQTLVDQVFAPEETREIVESPLPEPVIEENWYAFWSPFRSQLAANGFVAKLQESTGLDYRVVKVKTGVYEVAFAYTDDADIEAKLDRIAAATGLDMSGG